MIVIVDFSFNKYSQILQILNKQGFLFYTISEYFNKKALNLNHPFILFRHDVEDHYINALYFAQEQRKFKIKSTFYFRLFPKPQNERIIREIAELGHEIAYHCDDLSFCKGNYNAAIKRFETNLNILRKIAPVKTINMEGAPLSKYDNRDLWKKFNYHDFGIDSEPYFDLDFKEVAYYTDTGRRWDGRYSVRDKALTDKDKKQKEKVGGKRRSRLVGDKRNGFPIYRTTNDLIEAIEEGTFPKKVMINFHPQRWHYKPLPWMQELVWQNVKNQGKRVLIAARKYRENEKMRIGEDGKMRERR